MRFLFKSKFFIFLLFLLFSFAVIFSDFRNFIRFPGSLLSSAIFSVSRPVWNASGKVSDFFSFFRDLKKIHFENYDLREQNQRLLAENSYFKDLIKENNLIEKVKNLKIPESSWLVGRIVGMDAQNLANYIIVDIGENESVRIDAPVITENKIVVGKVVEVNKNFSKILTIADPLLKIAVKTEDSGAFGVLRGDYTKNFTIDLISKNESVKGEELVLTSGKDGIFIPGLIVGRIKDFQSRPEDLFQTVNARSDLDIYSLERVFIFKQP